MKASIFVGRVGQLAVALGIGAAASLGGGAVAWASPEDTSASPGGDSSTGAPQSSAAGSPARGAAARGRTSDRSSAPKPAATTRSDATTSPAVVLVTPKAAKDSTPAPSAAVSLPQPAAADRAAVDAAAPAAVVNQIPAATSNHIAVQAVPAPTAAVMAPVLTPVAAPAMIAAPAPQPAAAAGVVESVLAPLLGNGTGAPGQSPMSWVMLAAARRELDSAQATPSAAATVSTAQPVAPAAAALSLQDQFKQAFQAFFGVPTPAPPAVNTPPVIENISVKQDTSSRFGELSIAVKASDLNGDKLTYKVTTEPKKGVVVNAFSRVSQSKAENMFVFRPEPAARHAAAKLGAPDSATTATVTVTVTDAKGASTTQTVGVPISPTNKAPAAYAEISPRSDGNGATEGSVSASDPDHMGDKLTFSVPATTPKGGTVNIDGIYQRAEGPLSALGHGASMAQAVLSFTYTPSQQARHAAARLEGGKTPPRKYDTFTVTVADEYGGKEAVPVKVLVKPLNTAPTTTVDMAKPEPDTGIVRGAVTATDAENDPLQYKLTPGSKPLHGAVTVSADGGFAYTPTSAARTAARTFTTPMSDAFAVTVADEYGGTTVQKVSVTVEPFNSAPVAGTTTSTTNADTGVVTGKLNATDPEQDRLTYTAATTTTAKGTAVVTTDGSFSYTPTPAARHNAARAGAQEGDGADTFTATVSDPYDATTSIPVSVTITPSNTAPVAAVTVSTPDPGTGVVTGIVVASDADLDSLTYSGRTTTAKGSVTVGTDGHFTYTPTAAARDSAAGANAGTADLADDFTVTVDDAHGGSTSVPVSVAVSPAVPVAGIDDTQSTDLSEGDGGVTVSLLKVKLSRASADPVVVSYLITTSGSATAGVDFVSEQGSVGFAPGQTEAVIPVKVFGDTAFEPDESIGVVLTAAFNAKVVTGVQGGLTDHFSPVIKDDDAPPVPVSVSVGLDYEQSPNLIEGDSGTTANPLRVRLSGPSAQTVTVSYSFIDTGEATPGVDFVSDPGTVVFAPGQTLATIPVGVVGDFAPEENESFRVVINGATNANVVEGFQGGLVPSFNATIINDDAYQT